SPRCSCTILTARSRTSGENLFDLLMAQSSQSVEPPRNPGRFSFARKLACALFYKHTASIAPSEAPIAVRWYTNLQINNDEIPRELAELLVNFPTLVRAGTSLHDQFFYRWALSDTRSMAVFLAFFRESFALLTFINTSLLEPGVPESAHIVRPYKWA
ncbi:hypothetical protein, partial [Roseateles puraquae]|uniref:hypothetical protein n=1 Tax=Roseateles puraquae TaxID=431059 RepID=UPI0031DB333B